MDLFDFVRAAPPPQSVRDTADKPATETEDEAETGADSSSKGKHSSPLPLPISPIFNPENESDTEAIPAPPSPIYKLAEGKLDKDSVAADDDKRNSSQTSKIKNIDDDDDDDDDMRVVEGDGDEDGEEQLQPQPPKTKAQQKMFADLPLLSKKSNSKSGRTKECIVRIKRLSRTEIKRLMIGGPSKPNKRGRPRKSLSGGTESPSQEDSPSPTKKQKLVNSKVHIKVPWLQNGAKQRAMHIMARAHTPPPNQNRSPSQSGPYSASKALVQRYGRRYFNCVVKLKRLKGADSGALAKRTKRKSKSKLSVSFSEAVEILGSKPRKSSSIAGTPKSGQQSKLCDSVPTRLQRVDATGNVLEDIQLAPNMVLNSSDSPASRGKRGRSAACNGGRRGGKLKRPRLPVPVTDLASLRIDDSQECEAANDAEGEEYIVPNELPDYQSLGIRRSGTPTPVKRVTVTTTVSDEEGAEGPEPETNIEKPAATAETTTSDKEQATGEQQAEPQQAEKKLVDPEPKLVSPEPEQKQPEAVQEQSVQKDSNATSPVPTALADDATSDDILEIQTSLEDVRELHTPPSRQNTPEPLNRSTHYDSPESDSSFKSAHEPESSGAPLQHAAEQKQSPTTLARRESALDSLGTELTQPTDLSITFNGSEPGRGTSSIPQPPYSPIGVVPNLDDDDVGQLGEPDFQLSSTRHETSRGTLDDIMTVFET